MLHKALDISDTGWISGSGVFDPDGWPGPKVAYTRGFLMLVPGAGTYGSGDADFDGTIGFSDLVLLAQNYNTLNPTLKSTVADFDLSGAVNFDDLVNLAQHYNSTPAAVEAIGGADFAADWALAQTLAPEPSLMLAGAATAMLSLHRRVVG